MLSVDERDLRSKSINDLVLALKGANGVSRLRVRSQQGGAGDAEGLTAFLQHSPRRLLTCMMPAVSIVNFSRPINVYAQPRSTSHPDQGGGNATKVAEHQHAPAHHGRSYPAKAVMQWEYKVAGC